MNLFMEEFPIRNLLLMQRYLNGMHVREVWIIVHEERGY